VEVLRANPKLKGVLFDQDHVIEAAKGFMESHGVSSRCRLVSGDFFVSVPNGADACLLRHIIHDWDDETSVKLFKNIRKVLPENGRILVVDAVLPEGNTPHPGKLFDWIMMGIPGGVERTEAEFRDILRQGGFKVERIVPTAGLNSVIEAVPV